MNNSVLVDGNIPAWTECPFKSQCKFVQEGTCGHHGEGHTVSYSCAAARLFDLLQRSKYPIKDVK